MATLLETNVTLTAAPGSYATVFSFHLDEANNQIDISESNPVIIAWRINDDPAHHAATPIFAGRDRPAIFHPSQCSQEPMELVFFHDHDGRLRLFNGDTVVASLDEARTYAARCAHDMNHPASLSGGTPFRAADGSPLPF